MQRWVSGPWWARSVIAVTANKPPLNREARLELERREKEESDLSWVTITAEFPIKWLLAVALVSIATVVIFWILAA